MDFYAQNPSNFPAINPENVRMALIVGARTPVALARLFGVDPQDAGACHALSDSVTAVVATCEAALMDRTDGKLVLTLRGDALATLAMLRKDADIPKPSPRPRPEV